MHWLSLHIYHNQNYHNQKLWEIYHNPVILCQMAQMLLDGARSDSWTNPSEKDEMDEKSGLVLGNGECEVDGRDRLGRTPLMW